MIGIFSYRTPYSSSRAVALLSGLDGGRSRFGSGEGGSVEDCPPELVVEGSEEEEEGGVKGSLELKSVEREEVGVRGGRELGEPFRKECLSGEE